MLPAWVYTFIAVSVTAVWVVLNALDPLLSGYAVSPEMHLVMGSVVGGAMGGRVVAQAKDDHVEENRSKE